MKDEGLTETEQREEDGKRKERLMMKVGFRKRVSHVMALILFRQNHKRNRSCHPACPDKTRAARKNGTMGVVSMTDIS